jgi:hypothetical protein
MRITKCRLRNVERTSELNAAYSNRLRTLPLVVNIFRIPVPQSAIRNPHFFNVRIRPLIVQLAPGPLRQSLLLKQDKFNVVLYLEELAICLIPSY